MSITTAQADMIILLIIFLCALQIFILLRITQVHWQVNALFPIIRPRKNPEPEPEPEPEPKEDTQ